MGYGKYTRDEFMQRVRAGLDWHEEVRLADIKRARAKSPFPRMDMHGRERTPYAVTCLRCGIVYLTEREYDLQMDQADELWKCPVCQKTAYWNDANFEEMTR